MVGGSIDEAEALAQRAAELGVAAGQPDALTIYGAKLVLIRYQQGRLSELVELMERAAEDNPGIRASPAGSPLHIASSTAATRPARWWSASAAIASSTCRATS